MTLLTAAMMAALLLLSPWSIRSILTEIDDCMVVLYTIQFNNKKGQTTNRMETVEVVVIRGENSFLDSMVIT